MFSDHRQLKGIMQKELSDISNNQITKWHQGIMQYSFDLTWVPGKKLLAADALKRSDIMLKDALEIDANISDALLASFP